MRIGARALGSALLLGLAACSGTIADRGPGGSAPGRAAGSGTGKNGGAAASGSAGVLPDGGTAGTPFIASTSVARRLSRAELDNTLRDLLGDDTSPASRVLAEDLYSPYDNDYAGQSASGALIDSLEAMATDVATHVVGDPKLRAKLVPCTPAGPGDSTCFRQFVESFGRRAFRRPLASAEADAYMTLLAYATEDNPAVAHDFYTAVALVVRSVLQDPEFLYRIEVGTPTGSTSTGGGAAGAVSTLDGYEIAARMSYLLWGSTPDDALLADAEAGRLKDAAGRRTVAQRMLQDSRAKEQLHRFHAMWLGYRAIPQPVELTSAFQRETTALIDRIVFEQPQSYLNIFTFAQTRLDDFLADHYGLPHPTGGAGWVDYGSSGRAGILSHGSVLGAFSKFTDTSPTQRGILIRTRLLCQTIGRPPANVAADKPPGDKTAVCKFDRYSEHRSSSSCATCHSQLDPIGFGLENYDIAGVYRTHDDGLPQCTISGQGEVVGYGTFSGPGELGKLLVDKGLVEPCVARQFWQFAIGRAPAPDEDGGIEALRASWQQHGYELQELIASYVASPAFALRREPEMP
jgi:hypothetical protein